MKRSAAILSLFLGLAGCSEAPPPPVAGHPVRPAAPAPSPRGKTLEEKIAALKELEKASPRSFRRLQEGWTSLLKEAAGTPHAAKMVERLEVLDSEAGKAYRDLFRPIRAELRELLEGRRPEEARRKLEAWVVPAEFDFEGRQSKERERELELIGELCELDAFRRELLRAYAAGDISRDPREAYAKLLRSPRVYVRAEAESFRAEARRVRAMETARQRLAKTMERAPEGRRLFGEIPGTPVPTEKRLAATRPAGADGLRAALRGRVDAMAKSPSLDAFEARVKEGMAILDKGIRDAEWFPVTWYLRAEWRFAFLGDAMGALADLDQAIVLQRSFVEARIARAGLLLLAPLREQAEQEVRVLSRVLPDPARESAVRALSLAKAKDLEGAARELEQASRAMPDDLAFLDRTSERSRPADPGWAGEVRAESARYLVRLEVPKEAKDKEARQAAGRGFAAYLEAARDWFPSLLPGTSRPSGRVEVLIFADEEAYHDYADVDPLDQLNQTGGLFIPDRRQLALYEGWSPESTRATLTHEAMHEYMHAIGARVPAWLSEGVADYAAGITVKDGRVVESGRILADELDELKAAVREGWGGIPFATMLGEGRKEFYGVMRSLQYRQAWSMVHFFRHASGGRTSAMFDRYLREVARGKDSARAFTEAFGERDLEALRLEWLDYVRSLP